MTILSWNHRICNWYYIYDECLHALHVKQITELHPLSLALWTLWIFNNTGSEVHQPVEKNVCWKTLIVGWLVGCHQNVTSNAKNNVVIQLAPVSGVDVVLQKKMQLGMSVCTSCTKSSEASIPSLEKNRELCKYVNIFNNRWSLPNKSGIAFAAYATSRRQHHMCGNLQRNNFKKPNGLWR